MGVRKYKVCFEAGENQGESGPVCLAVSRGEWAVRDVGHQDTRWHWDARMIGHMALQSIWAK